jgi:hypothetical protein
MKTALFSGLMLALAFSSAAGQETLLTHDPLTALPLFPATDSRLHLGNEPVHMPNTTICKSKIQSNFYVIYDAKVDATLAWYGAHLSGFKKLHGYAMNRSQDFFYNADGTAIVSVTGSPAPDGQNTNAYSVSYMHPQPGLSEKVIVSMGTGKIVCQ